MIRSLVVLVAAAAVSLAGCTASSGPATIAVSSEHCGEGWNQAHRGQQTFILRNDGIATAEVYLTDAKSGHVFAYLDDLAPRSTGEMRIDLGGGRYAFRCAIADGGVAIGPTISVTGPASSGPPPVAPVTENDLIPLTKEYEAWVSVRLVRLDSLVSTLDADLRTGDPIQAKTDWLAAHFLWEQLGAAYDAFGDTGAAIDDAFQGVESYLWRDRGSLLVRNTLVTRVSSLMSTFGESQVQPLDLSVRAHEIIEDALRFELTGENDHGSGSTLSTIDANLKGTAEVVGLLQPLLKPRYPALAQTEAMLAATTSDVEALQGVPLAKLSTSQRERIDADVSQLAEDLAPIASICEPRRTT